jgi:endonuclease G
MPTASAQHESFALSNMIPQDQGNNRGVWAHIEEAVRKAVVVRHEGWVVTGPAFGDHPKRENGREAVPDHLWKAVFLPEAKDTAAPAAVGAYVVDNVDGAPVQIVSLDKLKDIAGIDPFPSLPAEMHAAATLPPVAGK